MGLSFLRLSVRKKVGTLEKRSIRKTNYDRLNDVLYLTLNTSRGRSYADSESPIGIEILRDIETDEITGLVIYYAEKQERKRQEEFSKIGWNLNIRELCES